MKSSEAGFRQLAPWIDRAFRFIEMIGITALLSVIIPELASVIRYLGTALACYYLCEPSIDAISYWIIPEVRHRQDILRISAIGVMLIAATIYFSPIVVGISERISRTISIQSTPGTK